MVGFKKKNVPVDNAFFVQEFEPGDNFGCIKPGSVLFKSAALLNVEHQVAPVQIFHHKEQVGLLEKFKITYMAENSDYIIH